MHPKVRRIIGNRHSYPQLPDSIWFPGRASVPLVHPALYLQVLRGATLQDCYFLSDFGGVRFLLFFAGRRELGHPALVFLVFCGCVLTSFIY